MRRMVIIAAAAGGAWAGYRFLFRPWWRDWGVESDERTRPLAGDEVIPDGETLDTRGITIHAPREAIWPWLVQMGYGRGGWYSYDAIDMQGRSADRLLPDRPALTVGDVIPTDPSGGFEVRLVEEPRVLVLYIDAETRARQERGGRAAADEGVERTPANLAASGAFLGAGMPPDFAVSWSFVLEPREGGRTRLIERMRGRMGEGDARTRAMFPLLGFGVFLMVRRQLLGIRDRVESAR